MIGYEAPQLASGIATLWPPSFCQTRGLRMIVANGLQRPLIWDGLQSTPDSIGITAPASGPTVLTPTGGAATAGTYYCAFRYKDAVHGTYSSLSPLTEVTAEADNKFTYSGLTESSESRVTHVEIWRSTCGQSKKVYLIDTVANGTTTYGTDTDSDETMGTSYGTARELSLRTADNMLWARRQGLPPNYMKVCVPFQDRSFWAVLARYDVGTVSVENGSATVTGVGTTWASAMEGREIFLIGGDKPYTILTVGSTTSITLDENFAGTTLSGVRYAIMADPAAWGSTLIYSEQDEFESVPTTQNTLAVQESLSSDNDWITGLLPHGTQLWVLKERHTYSVTFARQPKIDPGCHLRFSRGALNHRCADYYQDTAFLLDALGPWAIMPGDQFRPLGPAIQDYFRDQRVDFGKTDWWFVSVEPNEQVVRFCVTLEGQTGNQPKTALCYGIATQQWWIETYLDGLGGSTWVKHLGGVRTVVGGSYDRLLMLADAQSDGVSCQGSVTASTNTSLSDSTQSPFTEDMEGYDVTIVHGTGAGQVRTIETYDSTSKVTVDEAWETNPDTTSRYAVHYAIRGTATSADANSISDSTKTFSAQLAGATVAILSGTGSGQLRYLKTASGHDLTVSTAWTTTPSTDSVYLVGAVECQYRGGIVTLPVVDEKKEDAQRVVELMFEPTTTQQTVNWRLLWDHQTEGDEAWFTLQQAGVATSKGSVDRAVNLKRARSTLADAPGVESISFQARASRKAITHRFLSSELQWFQAEERVKLYGLEVE